MSDCTHKSKKKVVVFGASGIIGQHLRLCVPDGVEPVWVRRKGDRLHYGLDFNDNDVAAVVDFLSSVRPDVMINLAGESRTDEVERDPATYYHVNVEVPSVLSQICSRGHGHYVHVSTQAVFNGNHPPYHPGSQRGAVNAYGHQKITAEEMVERAGSGWTIVRPSFVLGVRPMPVIGRQNPIEQMLTIPVQRQVSDRWFSCSFARDVAAELWRIAMGEPLMKAIHIGIPHGVSRYDLALRAGVGEIEQANHYDFKDAAERPVDTTFADAEGACTRENGEYSGPTNGFSSLEVLRNAWKHAGRVKEGIEQCSRDLQARDSISVEQRARELSLFTGKRELDCLMRLSLGFHEMHMEVAADFRRANPQTDEELLEWYRTTDAYVWELSSYHCDAGVPPPGWNYSGMCAGIAERLTTAGARRVLCLGDGIGDLTLSLARRNFDVIYHDLSGSRTAAFAKMRFKMYLNDPPMCCETDGWDPELLIQSGPYDCIASLDFLEHVTSVEVWVRSIYAALKPDGLLVAQNAFNVGSGPEGSIPMHLQRNDCYEKTWDSLLESTGFIQQSSNWYQKKLSHE